LAPAGHVWTGASGLHGTGNTNWSNPANWLNNFPPSVNETDRIFLEFPASAANYATTDDIDDLGVYSIDFQASGYKVDSAFGTVLVMAPYSLVGPFIIDQAGGTTITDNLFLAVYTGTMTIEVDAGTLTINATMFESGGPAHLSVTGQGTLLLGGKDIYPNDPPIASTVVAAGNLALGNGAAAGQSLLLDDASTLLAAPGDIVDIRVPVVLNGAVTFTGVGPLKLDGDISGSGSLTMNVSAKVTLDGDNSYSGGTIVSGTSVVVGSDTALGTGLVTLDAPTALIDQVGAITLGNNMTLSGEVSTNPGPSNSLTLNGSVNGSGGFELEGGTLTLNGMNSYTGNTIVDEGTLVAGSDSALGSGELVMEGGTALASDVGDILLGNPVDLEGTVTVRGDDLSLTGDITGAGAFLVDGTSLILSGVNSYQGSTAVLNGTLILENPGALPNTTALAIDQTGTLSLSSLDVTIGSLAGAGTIVTSGLCSVTTGEDNTNTIFSGTITGIFGLALPFALTKVGYGTFTFSGTGHYSGATTIASGTVQVDGTLVGNVVVDEPAVLTGTGTIEGGIQVTGTVIPGDNYEPGILSTDGTTTFNGLSGLVFILAGSLPGIGFSQLVSNSVDLSESPFLYVLPDYVPPVGTSFTIVTANSVNGIFNGLPDGALFEVSGTPFTIHYTSTSVVLTVANYPAPVITGFSPVVEGDPAGTLTITGTGFFPDTGIELDGSFTADIYVSSTELQIPVPAFPEEGAHTVTAVNPTPGGGTTSQTLSVADAPLSGAEMNLTGTEETTFTDMVATFSDPVPESASSYTAFINWGDGNTTVGTVQPDGGNFMVLGSHTYLEEGSYTVATTIMDEGGSTLTVAGTASIADAPLIGIAKTVNFSAGSNTSGVVASFSDADPRAFAGQFTALVNWGDGITSNGTIVADGAGFDVTGNHAYGEAGTYTMAVTIRDAGGGSVSVNSTAIVAPTFASTGMLTSALSSSIDTSISGTFSSGTSSATFGLDFYANSSGSGQEPTFLGSTSVTTDAKGNVTFAADLAVGGLVGQWIIATAVDQSGATSEFAFDVHATVAPSQTYAQYLQSVLPQSSITANSLTIQASAGITPATVIVAVNGLTNATHPVTIILDLGGNTYSTGGVAAAPPANVSFVVQNGMLDPSISALTVAGGLVAVLDCTLTTSGDAPTLLVTGGSVSLNNDLVVQANSAAADPAIAVTGGTVTLGTASNPGNDTIDVNSTGAWIQNNTSNQILTIGDTLQLEGTPVTMPQAFDDQYVAAINQPLSVPAVGVLGNDVDPSGSALTAVLVSPPSQGALKWNGDGSFIYTPAANFQGTDHFTYQAQTSGGSLSKLATVTISINGPYLVTTTADSGPGSLRDALAQINADAGHSLYPSRNDPTKDEIDFDIPTTDPGYNSATGAFTIEPLSALPAITEPVTIDGYSQPGASPNTLTAGDNAVLSIQLDGASAGLGANGLHIMAGNSLVQGLDITNFQWIGAPTYQGGVAILLDSNGGNVIQGNFLGTDPSGTKAMGNVEGVNALLGAFSNTIGGTTPAARNLISGNIDGFYASTGATTSAQGNVIEGNYVGLNAAGTAAIPNTEDGVDPSSFDTVGGTTLGAGNVISGNLRFGIGFYGSDIAAQGNLVGTDATGAIAMGNDWGIFDFQGSGNLIGGTTASARNVISANAVGIEIAGNYTYNDIVQGNYIGTNAAGTAALGNAEDGILLAFTSANTIGGTTPGAGNVISGNGSYGIELASSPGFEASNNLLEGNFIGTDAVGTRALGNQSDGIRIYTGADDNQIGAPPTGSAAGFGNTIAFNGGAGVAVIDATSVDNTIRGNSIFGNSGLGIDLGDDGVTLNHTGSVAGPNNFQNFPVLTEARLGTMTVVTGTLNSLPSTTYTVDFFANKSPDPSGYGQGQVYLGSTTVITDSSGNANFTVTFNSAFKQTQFVTATATDPAGNTSEFAHVADLPLTAIGATLHTAEGTPFFGVVASFTDADPTGAVGEYAATINWGDGSAPTAGTIRQSVDTFTIQGSHTYVEEGSYTVTVTILDQGSSQTTATSTAKVAIVPPTTSIGGPTNGVPGQPRTFTFSATDVSPSDQSAGFVYVINWGDGGPVQTIPRSAGNASGVAADHIYTKTGSYSVRLTATDDGGSSAKASQSVLIQSVQMQGNSLAVGGTMGNDAIILSPADAAGEIEVSLDGISKGDFLPTDHILVYGQRGNDTIRLTSSNISGVTYYIAVPAFLYGGGQGTDTDVLDARGSTANNVLIGGAGTNRLFGGLGRDILIAGRGVSDLHAGAGQDILIGGWIDYDLASATMTYDHKLQALEGIMAEWGRSDLGSPTDPTGYLARVNDLLGPGAGGSSGGLNGSFVFNASTVHSSSAGDTLFGARKPLLDWFFASTLGVLKNKQTGEIVTAIQ
jgi:autotransporter-associated beta strand protein